MILKIDKPTSSVGYLYENREELQMLSQNMFASFSLKLSNWSRVAFPSLNESGKVILELLCLSSWLFGGGNQIFMRQDKGYDEF